MYNNKTERFHPWGNLSHINMLLFLYTNRLQFTRSFNILHLETPKQNISADHVKRPVTRVKDPMVTRLFTERNNVSRHLETKNGPVIVFN